MDRRIREQGDADIDLYQIDRELESQRLELHQATRWPDQA